MNQNISNKISNSDYEDLISNSLKNSSKGEPGGSCGNVGPLRPLITCVVEMLTTAGRSFSAKLAKLPGNVSALADVMLTTTKNNKAVINLVRDSQKFNGIRFEKTFTLDNS